MSQPKLKGFSVRQPRKPTDDGRPFRDPYSPLPTFTQRLSSFQHSTMKLSTAFSALLAFSMYTTSAQGFSSSAPSSCTTSSCRQTTQLSATDTIVIGGGRIGSLISNDAKLLGRNDPVASSIDPNGEGPIFIATRNDVLESIVEDCPESRRKDLVFLQNG
jgi:hypothetical protein